MQNNSIMASNIYYPNQSGLLIIDTSTLLTNYSWGTQISTPSPNLKLMLSARGKNNCYNSTCSYGQTTMWLDVYNSTSNTWLLTNLAHYYGLNSSIDNWSTWLYSTGALFNAWVSNLPSVNKQIYYIQIYSNFSVNAINLFSKNQLYDSNSYTGRISATPNLNLTTNTCFNGQRISFVRRTYNEPPGNNWAYWGSNNYLQNGSYCLNNSIQLQNNSIPILKTYVVELYSNCTPVLSWPNIQPVRQPPNTNFPWKQMGIISEWGDMLSTISPDGNYIAVAPTMGPMSNTNACAGFDYILSDINNINSGTASRMTQWCNISKNITTGQITCSNNMTIVNSNNFQPLASTPLPSFYLMGNTMTLIFMQNWAQYLNGTYYQIWQNNLSTGYQQMYFNTNGNEIYSAQMIY
jgi:hypothetical protein